MTRLIERPVRAAHQRAGLNMAESDILSDRCQLRDQKFHPDIFILPSEEFHSPGKHGGSSIWQIISGN